MDQPALLLDCHKIISKYGLTQLGSSNVAKYPKTGTTSKKLLKKRLNSFSKISNSMRTRLLKALSHI